MLRQEINTNMHAHIKVVAIENINPEGDVTRAYFSA
jgi:hypothetical protein